MSTMRSAASLLARRLSRPAIRAVMTNGGRNMASMSGGQTVAQLAKDLPHMDAVRYEHKNQKFAFKDIDHYAEALACGFLEQGFQPGDIVLSWLPEHFSEQVSTVHQCDDSMNPCLCYVKNC